MTVELGLPAPVPMRWPAGPTGLIAAIPPSRQPGPAQRQPTAEPGGLRWVDTACVAGDTRSSVGPMEQWAGVPAGCRRTERPFALCPPGSSRWRWLQLWLQLTTFAASTRMSADVRTIGPSGLRNCGEPPRSRSDGLAMRRGRMRPSGPESVANRGGTAPSVPWRRMEAAGSRWLHFWLQLSAFAVIRRRPRPYFCADHVTNGTTTNRHERDHDGLAVWRSGVRVPSALAGVLRRR